MTLQVTGVRLSTLQFPSFPFSPFYKWVQISPFPASGNFTRLPRLLLHDG